MSRGLGTSNRKGKYSERLDVFKILSYIASDDGGGSSPYDIAGGGNATWGRGFVHLLL